MNDNLESLIESANRAHAESIAAHRKRIEGLPQPMKFAPGKQHVNVFEQIGVKTYEKLPGNRAYALTDAAKLEFAALVAAAQKVSLENGQRLDGRTIPLLLENLATIEQLASLRQQRPGPEEPLPEMPIDPITKVAVKNPWLGTTAEDFASRVAIKSKSPKLAAWLEEAAKHDGVTAGMIARLEKERAKNKRLSEMPYGQAEWDNNLLRKEKVATATEQNRWAKFIDPDLLQFHQQEMKLGAPTLGFDNLTTEMLAHRLGPGVGAVYSAAKKLHRQWIAERQQKAA